MRPLKSRKRARGRGAFWFFAAPFLFGLLAFTYVPILWGFVLSFCSAVNTVTPTSFVGLSNYTALLASPGFINSLITGILFTVFVVPVSFLGALGLALLVHRLPVGSGLFRTIFFLPAACSYVLGCLVWRMALFNGLPFGLANTVIGLFGAGPVPWIATTQPPIYWIVIITVRLWLQLGGFMIIFLAGLEEIPREYYEAAQVDGARSSWQLFRYITFPLLRNSSTAIALLLTIYAFQAFDEFYNIFSSGTGFGMTTFLAKPPLVFVYQVAFRTSDFGSGSAGTFILTFVLLAFVSLPARWLRFGREERT